MSDEKNKANYLYLVNNKEIQEEFKWQNGTKEEDISTIPISKVNVIIGANNSRKSRFMRCLLKEPQYFLIEKEYINSINLILAEIDRDNILDTRFSIGFDFMKTTREDLVKIKDESAVFKKYLEEMIFLYDNMPNTHLIDTDTIRDVKNALLDFSNRSEDLIRQLQTVNAMLIIISQYDHVLKEKIYVEGSTFEHYPLYNILVISGHKYLTIMNSLISLQKAIQELLDQNFNFSSRGYNDELRKIYIPTLRGTTALYKQINMDKLTEREFLSNRTYSRTIEQIYDLSIAGVLVSTGLDLYEKVKKARNSKRSIRKKFEDFESFISTNFFNENPIDIVAEEGKNHLRLYIENEGEREFHHLGSGIQSLIILIYPLFMANEGDWFFIEEPELNMHPGLQSLFMHTILNNEVLKAKNLKIFLTTHSNHLLDTLLFEHEDCSILSFEKKNIADSKKTYTLIRSLLSPSNEALDLLGVSNSSVFMANCAVWIEGVSDRRYLKAFLLAYQRFLQKASFVENVHYAFFEYAGSNISHYDFDGSSSSEDEEQIKAYFLSNKIFLLADRDQGKNSKHDTLTSFNNEYFQYMDTEALEIENILSPSILKKVFKAIFKTQKTDATPEEIDVLEMTVDDYYTISMGEYIQSLNITERKIGSKTLTTDYKNKFSNTVLDLVLSKEITWAEIAEHPSAQKITIALYEFLKKHNPLALQ